jgi:hypothetical protein
VAVGHGLRHDAIGIVRRIDGHGVRELVIREDVGDAVAEAWSRSAVPSETGGLF